MNRAAGNDGTELTNGLRHGQLTNGAGRGGRHEGKGWRGQRDEGEGRGDAHGLEGGLGCACVVVGWLVEGPSQCQEAGC